MLVEPYSTGHLLIEESIQELEGSAMFSFTARLQRVGLSLWTAVLRALGLR